MPPILFRLQALCQSRFGKVVCIVIARLFCRSLHKKQRAMEMKRIACAILFAAASVSAVMADEAAAPAPSPASGASASLPIVGSLVGASLASFIALYQQ
ncbi:hypothetical protein OIU77_028499 [Salix suchowensis]|uniref:Arabinogalactan peptide 23-like n=1 Tax=Salix suchowensis TaxID=1278906 RepID=A0ABQ9BJR2_9ROSI|nr:hypothetical protein OIU77_028499 [Salix suchowensis]